jgi:hypothetical protein
MADAIYATAKAALLEGEINLGTGSIKCVLIDTADYTFDTGDEYYDVIGAAAKEETSAGLATKTFASGTFDADDITFSATTGDACEAVVIFVDTGEAAGSHLICYLDSLSGLPVTLGGDVTITWDAAGIFTI